MEPAAYRHQLRIAEVCRGSGDLAGCEKALGEFLRTTYPMADAHFSVELTDVYTDIARAVTELIALLQRRHEFSGASVEAQRVVGFFSGHNRRLSAVEPTARAWMMQTVAGALPEPNLQAQLYGAAAADFQSIGEATRAANAKLAEATSLFSARNFSAAHRIAVEARALANAADATDVEAQAVRLLSESFLVARDVEGSIGVILEFLGAPKELATGKNVVRARAELTETLGARYLSMGDRASAKAAFNNAAGLYARCGDSAKANELWKRG